MMSPREPLNCCIDEIYYLLQVCIIVDDKACVLYLIRCLLLEITWYFLEIHTTARKM